MAGLDFSVIIQRTNFKTAERKKEREIAVFICIFYWGYETLDDSKEVKYTLCIKLMASGLLNLSSARKYKTSFYFTYFLTS